MQLRTLGFQLANDVINEAPSLKDGKGIICRNICSSKVLDVFWPPSRCAEVDPAKWKRNPPVVGVLVQSRYLCGNVTQSQEDHWPSPGSNNRPSLLVIPQYI